MEYTDEEKKFLRIAIDEAKVAFKEGNYPVGAVLVINGKLIGKNHNKLRTEKDWVKHAETQLLNEFSSIIKEKVKEENTNITIYSSLEPCLMCLGTIVLNRVSKIIYACPDPHGGATHIKPVNLTPWYVKHWPEIKGGLYKEEEYELIEEFVKNDESKKLVKLFSVFEEMKKKW